MRKLVPFLLILIISCGKKEGEGVNHPPRIDRVSFRPEVVYTGDEIVLRPFINDPDGDKVKLTFNWYRNGELTPNRAEKFSDFSKGDRIEVEIVADDGKTKSKPFRVGPITIRNSPPKITRYLLEPFTLRSDTTLTLTVETEDIDGDRLETSVDWEINGEVVTYLHNRYTLGPDNFKRGDRIVGIISVSDGEDITEIQTREVTVENSPPRIVSFQTRYHEGKIYLIFRNKDYDNDPISLSVIEGPSGIVIDTTRPSLSWDVPITSGTYSDTLLIELSDPQGAASRTEIPITLNF